MAEETKKLYMEMQMDELKASLMDEDDELDPIEQMQKEQVPSEKKVNKNNKKNNEKNIELAKMYEDAAEYEEELESFEAELAVINANKLEDIVLALTKELPNEERDYAQELKAILVAAWTYKVETEKTHSKEQLDLIKDTEFCDVIEKLTTMDPDYEGDFAADVRSVLVKRLEMLIAIKKEHIEQEIEEIYIAGLKPSFVKRIYKQVHGLS